MPRVARTLGTPTDATEAYCPRCESDFTTFAGPCPKCSDYRHFGGCERCSCAPNIESRLCGGCFIKRTPNEWSLGADQCDVDPEGGFHFTSGRVLHSQPIQGAATTVAAPSG